VLATMLDEHEFLSPYGIRSLSRFHAEHPFVFHVGDQEYRVSYLPAESDPGMFGGNSNWRGPIRMPVNGLIIRLKQAVQRATDACPSLATKTVSPHVVRHTTAMHLLQAGVDIATIALWLGHKSIETTHVYLQADLAMKEKALGKLHPIEGEWIRFHADDPLLAFLASL
jgi:integrase